MLKGKALPRFKSKRLLVEMWKAVVMMMGYYDTLHYA